MADLLVPEGTRLVHVSSAPADALALRRALDAHRHEVSRTKCTIAPADPALDADADAVAAAAGVDGSQRVHVVLSLRPVDQVLQARWCDSVLAGGVRAYDQWLVEHLEPSAYDAAVTRWLTAVGSERITIVVANGPGEVLRAFERLLGLPGVLGAPQHESGPRELSGGETELVRHLFEEAGRRQWSAETVERFVRSGVVPRLQERAARDGEGGVPLPAPVRAQLADALRPLRDRVSELRVVGDSADLVPTEGEHLPVTATVSRQVAVSAMVAAIAATNAAPAAQPVGPKYVRELSVPAVAAMVGRRVAGGVARRARRR